MSALPARRDDVTRAPTTSDEATVAPALLELRGVSVTFAAGGALSRKRLHALREVSLTVRRGEVLALVGESGSGKSTVARVIARLRSPDSGQLLLDGEDVLETEATRVSLGYRRRVQMIFQDPFGSLNPVHSVRHHIERPLIRHGRATKPKLGGKVEELLDSCGLRPAAEFADKHPHNLSGGQRQRVAIARALAPEPDVVLADEPTSMLDVSVRMGVLNLLGTLRRERGLALLLITHDLASARYLADRIAVLYAGQLVEEADAATLVRSPQHPYTQLLLSAVPAEGRSILSPLAGGPGAPALVDPPPGCAFAARCPKAFDRCDSETPALHTLPARAASAASDSPSGGRAAHRSRCHLHDPAAATPAAA